MKRQRPWRPRAIAPLPSTDSRRRDFPMDARNPVTTIRYSHAGVSIRATAEGVFVDGTLEGLPQSAVDRLGELRVLAESAHRQLRAGCVPAACDEPSWIDTTEARRTT